MKITVLFCLYFVLVPAFIQAQELTMSEAEKAVAQILVQKVDGSLVALGTGFFVDQEGTLATALHVYARGISVMAEARGGRFLVRRAIRASKKYTATILDVLKTDYTHDLLLFRMREVKAEAWETVGTIKALPLSQLKEVQPNTPVKIIGYFGPDLYPVTVGAQVVGATLKTIAQGRVVEEFLVNASALPGQSGSPVLLEDDSLIGMINSIVPVSVAFNPNPVPSGLNRATKVEHIHRLLSSK